jgi:hypothetical protein
VRHEALGLAGGDTIGDGETGDALALGGAVMVGEGLGMGEGDGVGLGLSMPARPSSNP